VWRIDDSLASDDENSGEEDRDWHPMSDGNNKASPTAALDPKNTAIARL
jgi:hypothetical protein